MSIFDIECQEDAGQNNSNRREHSHCKKQTQWDYSGYNHFYYTVWRGVPTWNEKNNVLQF